MLIVQTVYLFIFFKKNIYCLLHTSAIDVWLTKEREQLGDLICLHSTQLCGYKKSNNDGGGGVIVVVVMPWVLSKRE